MDFTNLENDSGYVIKQDVFNKLALYHINPDDHYRITKLKDSGFSEVKAMCDSRVIFPLFKIYTGNKELYQFVCKLVEDVAKQFERNTKADNYVK